VRTPVDLELAQQAPYRYLLGIYLGDGYISRTLRAYRLEVSSHRNQERVVARVAGAITMLRPGRPVGLRRRGNVTIVNAYANAWPVLFPQHRIGRKHQRPIVLAPWQRRIVAGRNYPAIRSRITRRTSWSCSSGRAGWSGCGHDARIG